MLYLILGPVVVIGALFAVGLVLAVIGIQRGDRSKRLTGRPEGCAEAFARWLLTGSRGCEVPDDTRGH